MMPRLEAMELKNFANAVAYGSGNMQDPEAWAEELDRRRFGSESMRAVDRPTDISQMARMMSEGPSGMNMVLE